MAPPTIDADAVVLFTIGRSTTCSRKSELTAAPWRRRSQATAMDTTIREGTPVPVPR